MAYEITYDYSGENDYYNLQEAFEGTWTELQSYIEEMKRNGCYNIYAVCTRDYDYDEEEYE